MNKYYVSSVSQLEELYNDYAITWEGLDIDDENLEDLIDLLDSLDITMLREDFYITPGKLMNDLFQLPEGGRYPDDLNIVSIKLSDLENYEILFLNIRYELDAEFMNFIINELVGLDEDAELDFEASFAMIEDEDTEYNTDEEYEEYE